MSSVSKPRTWGKVPSSSTVAPAPSTSVPSDVTVTDQIPRIAVRIPDGAFLVPASEVPPGRDTTGYERMEVIIILGDASLVALACLRLDDASTLAVAQIGASFPRTGATVHHLPKKGNKP